MERAHWSRQVWVVAVLALLFFCLGVVGLYTLRTAPVLVFDTGAFPPSTPPSLQRVESVALDSTFFLRFPEFFWPAAEARWQQTHRRIFDLLKNRQAVTVELIEGDGTSRTVRARVERMSLGEAFQRSWLIYGVGLIFLYSGLSVFQRHRSPPGLVLSFFLLSCALYLVCTAPFVCRPITLPPFLFRFFAHALHTAEGGLITLVHFALVFPRPKTILARHPSILVGVYGYFALTVLLYSLGVTAYSTSLPFFFFWVAVIVVALLHSLVGEHDLFLRKQIRLTLAAPLLAALFFVAVHIPPEMPGVEPAGLLRFTYFILFSLILPFALPFALDNLTLYRERERIRADLHDISMRGLTNIARLSEGAQMQLDSGAESHEKIAAMGERLASIERIATDANRALRGIFEVSDERYGAWADLCGYLRNCGSQLVEDADIEFQLDDARSVYDLPPSSALARACLYFVYMEALENIVRHAQATQVKVSLRGDQTGAFPALLCDIEDDGVGFDPGVKKDGHFGLPGMTKRIEELGGELTIKSTARQGTCVSFRLPVTPNIPPMGEG